MLGAGGLSSPKPGCIRPFAGRTTPYLCRDRTSSGWSGVVGVELLCALVVRAHGCWEGCCARGRPALLRSATLGLAPGPAT